MPLIYHVVTIEGELPPTKTLPRPGQRQFWLKAPGVWQWTPEGEAVRTCMAEVRILQERGKYKTDDEGYRISDELSHDDIRNLPRDRYGRPARFGYVFVCTTREPDAERPGVYRVACDDNGRAYWCECLGAKGHHQDSQCKHRDLITTLAERSPVDRPAQPERSQ